MQSSRFTAFDDAVKHREVKPPAYWAWCLALFVYPPLAVVVHVYAERGLPWWYAAVVWLPLVTVICWYRFRPQKEKRRYSPQANEASRED